MKNESKQLVASSQEALGMISKRFNDIKMTRDMLVIALAEDDKALMSLLTFRLKILLIRQSVEIPNKNPMGFITKQ